MVTVTCQHCGIDVQARRRTRKYCSTACADKAGWKVAKARECRHCGSEFAVKTRADANRQHCSKECAKNANAKRIRTWNAEHPEAMKQYNVDRLAKNPGAYREKARRERQEIIELLGGACVVCGVDNPRWLHADFIPTQRNEQYRHPRHIAYVRRNKEKFRLLCANHHYELTLTGAIEGTDITQ